MESMMSNLYIVLFIAAWILTIIAYKKKNDGGIRYEDRTFPLFKRMLGFDNVPHNF